MKYTSTILFYPFLVSSLAIKHSTREVRDSGHVFPGIEFWPSNTHPEWHCETTENSPKYDDIHTVATNYTDIGKLTYIGEPSDKRSGTSCSTMIKNGGALVELCGDYGIAIPKFTAIRVMGELMVRCTKDFGGVKRVAGWALFETRTKISVVPAE